MVVWATGIAGIIVKVHECINDGQECSKLFSKTLLCYEYTKVDDEKLLTRFHNKLIQRKNCTGNHDKESSHGSTPVNPCSVSLKIWQINKLGGLKKRGPLQGCEVRNWINVHYSL